MGKNKDKSDLVILTSKASRLMSNQLNKDLSDHQITIEQWTVLANLWKNDGQTQQQLADLSNKNKASITHLIDHLEKSQLVRRTVDEQDKRNKIIYLTPEGENLQKALTKVIKKTTKTFTDGIDKKELKNCTKVLKKIVENALQE